MPGLSNPRHDPWSAAILPRPTLHTGISCHHHHIVLGDDADDDDHDDDNDVDAIDSVDGGLPHGGSRPTASHLPSQVQPLHCILIFLSRYLDFDILIWIF